MMNEKVKTESELPTEESVENGDSGVKRNREDGGTEVTGMNNFHY